MYPFVIILVYFTGCKFKLKRRLKSYEFNGCTSLRSHSMLDFQFTNIDCKSAELASEKRTLKLSDRDFLTNEAKKYSSLCLDQIVRHFEENLISLKKHLTDNLGIETAGQFATTSPVVSKKSADNKTTHEMKCFKTKLHKYYETIHPDDSTLNNLQK